VTDEARPCSQLCSEAPADSFDRRAKSNAHHEWVTTLNLARLFVSATRLVLPPRCVLCGVEAGTSELCASCMALLDENLVACARCAQPLPQAAPLCGACLRKQPPFDAAFAGYVYQEPFAHLVQRLKFNQSLACARALGPRWATSLRVRRAADERALPQALIPIPLHTSRLRQRGYNQALELARELTATWSIPVLAEGLMRTRATAPQPGLDLDERRRNLRGAFAVGSAALPKRVALVDDVMTTGATLAEATKILKRAGVAWVELWVLARRP